MRNNADYKTYLGKVVSVVPPDNGSTPVELEVVIPSVSGDTPYRLADFNETPTEVVHPPAVGESIWVLANHDFTQMYWDSSTSSSNPSEVCYYWSVVPDGGSVPVRTRRFCTLYDESTDTWELRRYDNNGDYLDTPIAVRFGGC